MTSDRMRWRKLDLLCRYSAVGRATLSSEIGTPGSAISRKKNAFGGRRAVEGRWRRILAGQVICCSLRSGPFVFCGSEVSSSMGGLRAHAKKKSLRGFWGCPQEEG